MKLENGKAEAILANLISEWEQEGDINGTKINENMLKKFTRANWLAMQFFKGMKDAEITIGTPKKTNSSTSTDVICSIIEYERGKDGSSEKSEMLQELIGLVDYFSVSPVTSASVHLRFSVDGIWSE